MDTIGIVEAAEEIDGSSLHVCFLWIKHQIIFVGNLHEVLQAGIMFCLSTAMDSDVICNSNTSLALFEDLIHLLLEDVLWTDEAKGKSQQTVSSEGTVESCKQTGVLVKDDWPVSKVGIQLGEEGRVCKLVSDFLHSGNLVMILVDGLIEVMGIQAQA